MDGKPLTLYHVATGKLAWRYRKTDAILKPVRGFDSITAAMAWAIKVQRRVIYSVHGYSPNNCHKLPDHHNKFGNAWWIDEDVPVSNIKCVWSGDA